MMPGFVENIAFAKLILKRPAYLGRDNQPDLSENNPWFSLFHFLLSLSLSFPPPSLPPFLAVFQSRRP